MGRRQRHPDPRVCVVSGPLGVPVVMEGNSRGVPHFVGKVFDAVEHVVAFGLEHRKFGRINAIGVDEIQYAKGHKYLTLVYQIDLGATRLLWVGRERTIESSQGFFTVIGDELASKITFVCSDMWEPYLKVIREKCSEALHILDRFHIVAKMNNALDEGRAGGSRRMAREGYA
jgi:transposase